MIEVTDTFCGQANYGWAARHTFDYDDARYLVRRAKAAAGLTGIRCLRTEIPGGFQLDVIGQNVVAFIDII